MDNQKVIHMIRHIFAKFLRPRSKQGFFSTLKSNSKLLDVGCGNNAVIAAKIFLPNAHYTGLDIGDYNQYEKAKKMIDSYIITTPNNFHVEIGNFKNQFDAVVSCHNLEHVNNRSETLSAMLGALKVGGLIYLSFPCEQSVNFPNRSGTLNYYDDTTHKGLPPDFSNLLITLKENGLEIFYSTKNYKPMLLRIIGFLLEPLARVRNKVYVGTWEFYGFESIIIARKLK